MSIAKFMNHWEANTRVSLYPFTRQVEEDEVIIGRLDTGVFLVLPYDALALLDFLAAGKTVEQAQSLYAEKYGEVPDMEDFLDLLAQKGFVHLATTASEATRLAQKSVTVPLLRYHFTHFPQSLAQRCFSRPVLLSCGVLIGLALMAIILEPSIIPGWRAFFFEQNLILMAVFLTIFGSIRVFLHEMAHLIAARAVGVASRLGISNRMWILVAETDMTGIWSVPRNHRYLPLLAGSLLDTVSAAILLLVLFAHARAWLSLSPGMLQLGQAILLIYLLGLLWQCYFFVRTDFYYVLANFFRCKDLMKDTEIFLWNQLSKIIPCLRKIEQSPIKPREMAFIRFYAGIWLLGRTAAIASLIFISFPLLWNYFWTIWERLQISYQKGFEGFFEPFLMALMFLPLMVGFYLWIFKTWTLRRSKNL